MEIAKPVVSMILLLTILFGSVQTSPLEHLSPVRLAAAAGSFSDSTFVSGLNTPTAMDFSPDGRLFVSEKGGNLKIIKNGVLLATPFLSVSVNSSGERGLLGIAFDPSFATNGYVYVYYTTSATPIHNRVSRFTADPANPDVALAGSELQILNLETLSTATNHNGGAIHFGKDGKLYIAVGENANSANSQSLSTRLGKILRINSDGTIPSDNPFFNTVGAKQEIWALGLRNPFTFAFSPSPSSSLMYINDVGQDTWEEIDSGISGANYGWPTCEGVCSNPSFVNPIYAYAHNGAGKAIAGAAFYQSNQFPSDYVGSYFFGDYVAGFIKRMTPSGQVFDFLPSVNSPVDIKIGSDGSLYYLSIGGGSVHKVQYITTGNSNPVAVAQASPTSGPPPLSVNFDGTSSSDPDPGTVLSYSWNFGDGSPAATGAIVTHLYNSAGPFVATLTVNDGSGGTNSATVNITVGNPPNGTIDTPVQGTKYSGGDTISFSGSGTDNQNNVLPASAFHWVILFHHNTHTHPFLEFNGTKSGSFVIPTLGETSSDVWYRIYLTVTDSTGLTNLSTRDVLPNKSTITLTSNVSGLQVNLDGQPQTTPYSFVGVVGMTRTLQAPSPQSLGGQSYQFQSWSDGGAATHTISTPSSDTTYTENYSVVTPPPTTTSTLTVRSQDMGGNTITGYWTVLQQGTTTIGTGFTPATFTLNNGVQYSIGVGNYGNYYFDHWLDTGSTIQPRSISISVNTELTAVYRSSAATATISLNPTSGLSGTSVTVTGTNFLTNTAITIRYDGGIVQTTSSTITSNSNGGFSASFNVPASTSGGHTVSATDGTRTASSTFTVNNPALVASSTAISSGTNPSGLGQSVTFTATVTGSSGTPTGTVTFRDGATTIGTGTLAGGTTTLTTASLAVGTHSITASFGGNSVYNPSTSSTLTQTVNKGGTTTTISSNANPSGIGQPVTFTATVSPVSPATGTRTGTVTFYDGATTIGIGTLAANTATFTTTSLTTGSHSITAVYSGDANFNTSTSLTLTQSITSSGTTYPIVHMQDTTVSFATLLSSSRPVVGEYVTATSQLVGDRIDKITLQLQKVRSPIGIAQIGVFNSDLSVKKLFGTIDATTISTSLTNYQFQLPSTNPLYTIQPGDIIGIKFTGSSNQGGVNLTVDRNSADPFDGSNSYRVRYESSWKTTLGDDMYMILEQTHG
ncbi:MAG TPA: PQQ-dependent sugar dehydrogenase [Nitrosopumilaceae archaeon]|nr:PQQ-dependent sugar dehydrogenase [Nitrosopumilaceae archaeon]